MDEDESLMASYFVIDSASIYKSKPMIQKKSKLEVIE